MRAMPDRSQPDGDGRRSVPPAFAEPCGRCGLAGLDYEYPKLSVRSRLKSIMELRCTAAVGDIASVTQMALTTSRKMAVHWDDTLLMAELTDATA
jgi:hypothetical protein